MTQLGGIGQGYISRQLNYITCQKGQEMEKRMAGQLLDEAMSKRILDGDLVDPMLADGYIQPDKAGGYKLTQTGNEALRLFNPAHYKEIYPPARKPSRASVVRQDGHYVWTGGYKSRDLPKTAGFLWDAAKRYWWTDDAAKARKLFDFADFAARAEMGSPDVADGMDDYKDIVLEGLQLIASQCDYAKELDGVGFAKGDASIGHSLAAKRSLTVEQAQLGLPLLRLHQHQLPEWMVSVLQPYFNVVDRGGSTK